MTLHKLLDDAAKNDKAAAGSKERMAGDFYKKRYGYRGYRQGEVLLL